MGDTYRPKNVATVKAWQWVPQDAKKVMAVLTILSAQGIDWRLMAYEDRVELELEGYTADLEGYDWLVQERPLTRPKILTNNEFTDIYEKDTP